VRIQCDRDLSDIRAVDEHIICADRETENLQFELFFRSEIVRAAFLEFRFAEAGVTGQKRLELGFQDRVVAVAPLV
jgi:hypothetical protein